MGQRAQVYKFDKTDKKTIRGKVKHSRTGQCTCKIGAKCYHGKNYGRSAKG